MHKGRKTWQKSNLLIIKTYIFIGYIYEGYSKLWQNINMSHIRQNFSRLNIILKLLQDQKCLSCVCCKSSFYYVDGFLNLHFIIYGFQFTFIIFGIPNRFWIRIIQNENKHLFVFHLLLFHFFFFCDEAVCLSAFCFLRIPKKNFSFPWMLSWKESDRKSFKMKCKKATSLQRLLQL